MFNICLNSDANFTQNCNDGDGACQCSDYLSFSEPPYEDSTLEKKWCGIAPFEFRSRSRVLVINFFYRFGHNNSFILNYLSESIDCPLCLSFMNFFYKEKKKCFRFDMKFNYAFQKI